MIHGFDLENDLVCEGIIGDGCGGGRIFLVKDDALFAYDPQTDSSMLLLKDVLNAVRISKKSCLITIECKSETICFDLSSLSKV